MKNGFTLLELLMGLAIILIVSTFGYAFSIKYLTRANRIEGQTALLDLANRMETFLSKTGSYETATIGVDAKTDLLTSALSAQGLYRLSITRQTADSYLLKAQALGLQAERDKDCKVLFLDSSGLKGNNLQFAKNRDCWS